MCSVGEANLVQCAVLPLEGHCAPRSQTRKLFIQLQGSENQPIENDRFRNDRKLPLVDLVDRRNPEMYKKSWIYCIGDYEPPDTMVQEFKDQDIGLLYRKKHGLLPNEEIANRLGFTTISEETHRDLFAIIDFFVCSEIEAFIGNSVSTFSANQIAIRRGINSSWYNSRGIPLADFLMKKWGRVF